MFIAGSSFQVIVVPIWKKADERAGVLDAASSVKQTLQAAGIKIKVDDSEQRTPGWKFNFWEMKVCSCNILSVIVVVATKTSFHNQLLNIL